MPKILKSKITGSGNISLSGRIKIREYDNQAGAYPTSHRLGDQDRSGAQSLKPFDDQSTLIFGKKIFDDFENSGVDNDTLINTNKWTHSAGLRIRNEILKQKNGQISLGKSLVFEGPEVTRFLQTKEKIRNPSVSFSLQQGPYNIDKKGLNLGKAALTDTLKVQISPDASSWTTIVTYTPTDSLISFYGEENIKQNIFRKNIKLSMQDFPDPGESYYLRIMQDSISSKKLSVWAITDIKIEYTLENNITFGIQNNLSDEAGKKVYQSYISTPHTASELRGLGFVRKSISDKMLTIVEKEELITPFNEKKQALDLTKEFFNIGTDPGIYPGFEIPSKNKTIFTIDLSPSEETTFGIKNFSGNTRPNNLMTYWNNSLKKWDVLDGPLSLIDFDNSSYDIHDLLITSSDNTCIGFGPQPFAVVSSSVREDGSVGYGNWNTPREVYYFNKDYLSATSRPIDTFEFPFGVQYAATSSNYIIAKDIGITKPFILEKCSLDFDMKIQLSSNTLTSFSLNAAFTSTRNSASAFRPSDSIRLGDRLFTPTFFILKQSNQSDSVNYQRSIEPYRREGTYREIGLLDKIITGSTRELITYGQFTYITTGSILSKHDMILNNDNFTDTVLSRGLERDGLFIDDSSANGAVSQVTGSFSMNFKSKITPNYEDFNLLSTALRYTSVSTNSGNSAIKTGKKSLGRSISINNVNRGIVNSTGPKLPGIPQIVPAPTGQASPTEYSEPPDSRYIEIESPYLINPSDKIIFGWQCPLSPVTRDATNEETMTLFRSAKLKLIGSLVADKKEYHETINQNLTSNAIYENILGNEKIIDQWQIEVPAEYSGSYLDIFLENIANQTISNTRANRIGQQVKSIVSGSAGSLGSFGRYLKANDQERIFLDSNKNKGAFFNNSFYGTMNAQGFNVSGTESTLGKQINPKYYYNYQHFGYYSDLLRQSFDGKYAETQKTLSKDEIVSSLSPISIKFVKGEKLETPDIKAYKTKNTEELMDDAQFQSSNISIFSTSSIPFIDDNKPRNRAYVSGSFIAV